MTQATAPTPVRAVLMGAGGRMGQAILNAAAGSATLTVAAAIVAPGSALAGTAVPAGALHYRTDLAAALKQAQVAIDFSSARATLAHLNACRTAGTPLLIGTTGFPVALEAEFTAAAREIPLLVAANTSIGVTVLEELVRIAARVLPRQFTLAITESHHAGKRDAPSGTALVLARAARAARPGEGTVEIQSVRAGDIVGEHLVRFSGPGEELTLAHKASDRGLFAAGALAAAVWLSAQLPGRYAMRDVLAIKTAT